MFLKLHLSCPFWDWPHLFLRSTLDTKCVEVWDDVLLPWLGFGIRPQCFFGTDWNVLSIGCWVPKAGIKCLLRLPLSSFFFFDQTVSDLNNIFASCSLYFIQASSACVKTEFSILLNKKRYVVGKKMFMEYPEEVVSGTKIQVPHWH